jgi:phosphoribosyl 1,2-cyclic phosphodiesterase
MLLTFWGTRGSIPTPGPKTVRYGGNTSCVSIRPVEGSLIILDAGTGIRSLGKEILTEYEDNHAVLFLSHSHWDHIQGFPLFIPVYREGFKMDILGSPVRATRLEEIFTRQQDCEVFPVPLSAMKARLTMGSYSDDWVSYGSAQMRAFELQHPGGACGFRFEEGGRSIVYMTDNELPESGEEWERYVEHCRNADLLIHDAQYIDEELPSHRGWGHSSILQATRLALEAGVKQLALFHHDPDRSDQALDRLVDSCRAYVYRQGKSLHLFAAAEGHSLEIGSSKSNRPEIYIE